LYAKDQAKFNKYAAALTRREETLASKEEQWLELEVMREELEL